MRPDYQYYLDQAELCFRLAKRANTQELRSQWDTLAHGWLFLIPADEKEPSPELYPASSHESRSDTPDFV
jgi:hypothetical protein